MLGFGERSTGEGDFLLSQYKPHHFIEYQSPNTLFECSCYFLNIEDLSSYRYLYQVNQTS